MARKFAAKRTTACTGTLIAPRVVLTAAHCADGGDSAFVRAPNASAQSSNASQILEYYDWQKTSTGSAREKQHDLALVVLEHAITISDYARLHRRGRRQRRLRGPVGQRKG